VRHRFINHNKTAHRATTDNNEEIIIQIFLGPRHIRLSSFKAAVSLSQLASPRFFYPLHLHSSSCMWLDH